MYYKDDHVVVFWNGIVLDAVILGFDNETCQYEVRVTKGVFKDDIVHVAPAHVAFRKVEIDEIEGWDRGVVVLPVNQLGEVTSGTPDMEKKNLDRGEDDLSG